MRSVEKQYRAWALCAFTVPGVLFLPSCGWVGAVGAASFTALLWCLLCRLRRNRGWETGLPAMEKKGGRLLCLMLLLWNLLALSAAAGSLCAAFPTAKDSPLTGFILLLLAAYAAQKQVLPRVGALCLFFLLGLYGLLFGFALPNLQKEYLLPEVPKNPLLLSTALAPLGLHYLCPTPEKGKAPHLLLPGIVAFSLLPALITVGSLSPAGAETLPFPFYEAAKSVNILNAIQRLEPLVSCGLCVGGLCLLGLYCSVNRRLLQTLSSKAAAFSLPVNFLGACLFFPLLPLCGSRFLAVGTTIFWGVFPFLLLVLVPRKKTQKF